MRIYLKIVMIVCSMVSGHQTISQTATADSTYLCLQSLLRQDGLHDRERFCLRNWADLLIAIDDSIAGSLTANDTASLLQLWETKGLLLHRVGKARDVIRIFEITVPVALRQGFNSSAQRMLFETARIYEVHAKFDSSLTAYSKALDLMERVKDSLSISELYADLGWLHRDLQDTSKAMELFKKSFDLKERMKTSDGMSRLLVYQGILWADMQQFKRAHEFFSRGLRLCQPDCPASLVLLELSGRGRALLNEGKLAESREVLQEVATLARIWEDRYRLADALYHLGVAEIKSGRKALALKLLNEALVVSRENEFNMILLNTYDALIKIHPRTSGLDRLAELQSLYIELENRIYGEKVLIRISSAQAEFETREDAHLVQSQKQLMAAQEKTLQLKRYVNIAIGIVLLILLGIVGLLYKMNRRRQMFNQNLDRMVHERTHELEAKQLELERVSSELGFEMETMNQQMKSQLSTLEGIYYLAQKDGSSGLSNDKMRELKATIDDLKYQMSLMRELRLRPSERDGVEETGQLLG